MGAWEMFGQPCSPRYCTKVTSLALIVKAREQIVETCSQLKEDRSIFVVLHAGLLLCSIRTPSDPLSYCTPYLPR